MNKNSEIKPAHQDDVLIYGYAGRNDPFFFSGYYNDGWCDMYGESLADENILYWDELPNVPDEE